MFSYFLTSYPTISSVLYFVWNIVDSIFVFIFRMLKNSLKTHSVNLFGSFVSINQWQYEDTNMNNLCKEIKDMNEKNMFNVDVQDIRWEDYFKNFLLGIRQFMLKDNPDTLLQARTKMNR